MSPLKLEMMSRLTSAATGKEIMNEKSKSKKGWRILRRILIALAMFATLIAIFYTEKDWRGKRAREKCKPELEAKGAVLDWRLHSAARAG